MRELNSGNALLTIHEYIVYSGEPGELKHLSTRRKRKKTIDFLSSGERTGKSLNLWIAIFEGVTDSQNQLSNIAEHSWKAGRKRVTVS